MKNSLLFSIVITMISTNVWANEALIRHGLFPAYGKTMKIKSNKSGELRISGGEILDLIAAGAGEEQDVILSCYEGSEKDVCELLEVAIKEYNEKQDLTGDKKFKIHECKKRNGNIFAFFRSEKGEGFGFGFTGIPACEDIN